MSVIQFLTSGGMATTEGDLSDEDRKSANEIVKRFGSKIQKSALALQMPASQLKIQQCTYLLVAKDISSTHFVFADVPGSTTLNYRDLSSHGRLELQSIVHQVRIEVGDVIWAFSTPQNAPKSEIDEYIQSITNQYVNSVLQSQNKPDKKISDEAISMPELASGIEKFRVDYPVGTKTAFIIMRFGDTQPHSAIVKCVKDTLKQHGIVALRADDKEYMDEMFPNIRTYMHACDFGIAIFDRIIEDDFNPNVSLEVGYMLGMSKNVLLLKDQTLQFLQTDLTGKLYKPFDTNNVNTSIPPQIEKWLTDKGLS